MTSDAIIEAAARRLHEAGSHRVSWDATSAFERDTCRAGARALAAAGLLATESPGEPLPVDQVRREPDTSNAWQKRMDGRWHSAHPFLEARLTDYDVRDWPILVPETDLDDVCADRDRLVAQLAAVKRGRDRDTIREHIPAATHPPIPEVPVAANLRGAPRPVLDAIADWDHEQFAKAARDELARRAAEAGVSS